MPDCRERRSGWKDEPSIRMAHLSGESFSAAPGGAPAPFPSGRVRTRRLRGAAALPTGHAS
jgi:hypothetical protein